MYVHMYPFLYKVNKISMRNKNVNKINRFDRAKCKKYQICKTLQGEFTVAYKIK